MGVSKNGGTQEWMVYFMENPIYKWQWMITRGTPISGNPPIIFQFDGWSSHLDPGALGGMPW